MGEKFYITQAIPYVNAKPHIGHALELAQADAIARYHRVVRGDDTLFLWGSDDNALKNVLSAEKAGKPVGDFVKTNAESFRAFADALHARVDHYQRTSEENHARASQELWRRCAAAGDLYKKAYTGLYCVPCEMFYTPEELDANGECFEHPGKKLDEVSEENYFFKLSRYQSHIESLLESGELRVVPEARKNEMLSFVRRGLQDFSVSRSNERARNWGVPVPRDDSQRMYVWFDALNVYQSGVGFGTDEEMYKKWWPADVHVIGKGIARFHAIYWPAMLLSAVLTLPKSIMVHGYLTVEGQKISKTLGNVIDPNDLIARYGAEALRYFLLAKASTFDDSNFSEENFREVYNADLANGLGNLVSRVMKMAEQNLECYTLQATRCKIDDSFANAMENFELNKAVEIVWRKIAELDRTIQEKEPFRLVKSDPETGKKVITELVDGLAWIAFHLAPFMPETAEKINTAITENKMPAPLFARLDRAFVT